MGRERRRLLAVVYRHPLLATAVFDGNQLWEMDRHWIGALNDNGLPRARRVIGKIIGEYTIDQLVVERRAPKIADGTHTDVIELSAAKAVLLGSKTATARKLATHLIEQDPSLRRFVRVLKTGRIAVSDRRQVNQLLPVALGLAWLRANNGLIHNNNIYASKKTYNHATHQGGEGPRPA